MVFDQQFYIIYIAFIQVILYNLNCTVLQRTGDTQTRNLSLKRECKHLCYHNVYSHMFCSSTAKHMRIRMYLHS